MKSSTSELQALNSPRLSSYVFLTISETGSYVSEAKAGSVEVIWKVFNKGLRCCLIRNQVFLQQVFLYHLEGIKEELDRYPTISQNLHRY